MCTQSSDTDTPHNKNIGKKATFKFVLAEGRKPKELIIETVTDDKKESFQVTNVSFNGFSMLKILVVISVLGWYVFAKLDLNLVLEAYIITVEFLSSLFPVVA